MEQELTFEEKKNCLRDEVFTFASEKEREGDVWIYPIWWGNNLIFDVPARNKCEAIDMAIEIIAEEEWDGVEKGEKG